MGHDVTAAEMAVITRPCPVHNYLRYLTKSKHNFIGNHHFVSSDIGESRDHREACPFFAVECLQDKTSMINTDNTGEEQPTCIQISAERSYSALVGNQWTGPSGRQTLAG